MQNRVGGRHVLLERRVHVSVQALHREVVGLDHLVVGVGALVVVPVRTQSGGADPGAERDELVVELGIVAVDDRQFVHRLARYRLALSVVPVLDHRLGDLARGVVRDGQRDHVLLGFRVILRRGLAGRLRQVTEDVPVGLGLPHGCDGRRQRVDEGVQVRGVEVGLLVPGGCGKHDVRVERRRVHAEVQVDDQVHLPDRSDLVPLHFGGLLLGVLGDGVVVGAEVVLEGVLVPLHAPHDRVAAPDVPHAREVALGLGIAHRVLQLLALELLEHVPLDALVVGGPAFDRLLAQVQTVLVELRVEGHPPHAHGFEDLVRRVLFGQVVVRHRVVLGELPVVAVLARVHVVPDRRLLEAGGGLPVLAESDGGPGVDGGQLLLAHIVVETPAVLTYATGEHEGHGPGPVDQVGVIPVVDARPDDDHALAVRGLGGVGPLAGEL